MKKFIQRVWAAVTTVVCIVMTPLIAFAAENPDISTGLDSVDSSTLADKIISIATGAGAIAGAIAVCMLIYAGIRMATATNEQGQAQAKGQIVQVLLGLGIVGLAVMIVGFVAYLVKGSGSA